MDKLKHLRAQQLFLLAQFAIIVGVIGLNIASFLSQNPINDLQAHGDESYYQNKLLSLKSDWKTLNPSPIFLNLSLAINHTGVDSLISLRIISILSFIAMAIALILLIKKNLEYFKVPLPTILIFALLILNAISFQKYFIMGIADALFALLFLSGLFFHFKFISGDYRNKDIIFNGLLWGVALSTRPLALIFLIPVCLIFLLFDASRLKLEWPKFSIIVVSFILSFGLLSSANLINHQTVALDVKGDSRYWFELNYWTMIQSSQGNIPRGKILTEEFNQFKINNTDFKTPDGHLGIIKNDFVTFSKHLIINLLFDLKNIFISLGIFAILPFIFLAKPYRHKISKKDQIFNIKVLIFYWLSYLILAVFSIKFVEFRWMIVPTALIAFSSILILSKYFPTKLPYILSINTIILLILCAIKFEGNIKSLLASF